MELAVDRRDATDLKAVEGLELAHTRGDNAVVRVRVGRVVETAPGCALDALHDGVDRLEQPFDRGPGIVLGLDANVGVAARVGGPNNVVDARRVPHGRERCLQLVRGGGEVREVAPEQVVAGGEVGRAQDADKAGGADGGRDAEAPRAAVVGGRHVAIAESLMVGHAARQVRALAALKLRPAVEDGEDVRLANVLAARDGRRDNVGEVVRTLVDPDRLQDRALRVHPGARERVALDAPLLVVRRGVLVDHVVDGHLRGDGGDEPGDGVAGEGDPETERVRARFVAGVDDGLEVRLDVRVDRAVDDEEEQVEHVDVLRELDRITPRHAPAPVQVGRQFEHR